MFYTMQPSPLGELLLVRSESDLAGLYLEGQSNAPKLHRSWRYAPKQFQDEAIQLKEYFAKKRAHFTLRLDPFGTPFQRRVWDALQRIPYGQTCSYGELASRLGMPNAARAVGAANARNPISIVVPCHRVIGRHGSLTGYASGTAKKAWLLDWESWDQRMSRMQTATARVARPGSR